MSSLSGRRSRASDRNYEWSLRDGLYDRILPEGVQSLKVIHGGNAVLNERACTLARWPADGLLHLNLFQLDELLR